MKRFVAGLLALLGLVMLAFKAAFMLLALILLTIDEWLDAADKWLSHSAAKLGGFQLPTPEDDE